MNLKSLITDHTLIIKNLLFKRHLSIFIDVKQHVKHLLSKRIWLTEEAELLMIFLGIVREKPIVKWYFVYFALAFDVKSLKDIQDRSFIISKRPLCSSII